MGISTPECIPVNAAVTATTLAANAGNAFGAVTIAAT